MEKTSKFQKICNKLWQKLNTTELHLKLVSFYSTLYENNTGVINWIKIHVVAAGHYNNEGY